LPQRRRLRKKLFGVRFRTRRRVADLQRVDLTSTVDGSKIVFPTASLSAGRSGKLVGKIQHEPEIILLMVSRIRENQ
jgi:hypothetical protein